MGLYCTKYVFGEIVAVNQIDSASGALAADTLSVPVNGDLLVVGEDAATNIVLMSGSDIATTADTKVVALAQAPVEYTITFDVDGVTSTATTVEGKVTAPAAPTKDGFTFKGWGTTANDATTIVDLSTYVFAADDTLYAIFEANAPTYTTNVISNVFGQTGAKVIRYYGIGAGKVVTVDGVTAKSYTNPVTEELVYIVAIPASENEPVVSITDGTSETILFGDVNASGAVDANDVNILTYSANNMTVSSRFGTTTYTLPTDLMELMVYDVNASNNVDANDVNILTYAANNMTVSSRFGTTTYSVETLSPLFVEASE